MRLLCLLDIHKWVPLQYKLLESLTRHRSQYTRSTDQRLTREYCIRCGKIRNLIEFEDEIMWKDSNKLNIKEKET